MVAYLGYTLRMRTLFRGWPIMVNDTHTRRRRLVAIIMCCKWWLILILMLMSNLLSISWNIAWMGGGALRCICGRHQPGQLRLERYWGWLFHHMGRKRVPVSYGSNRKRVVECLCWRTDSTKFKLMFCPGSVISCSGWIPTWPMITW